MGRTAVVAAHAVELERRMHEAGALITIQPSLEGWSVEIALPPREPLGPPRRSLQVATTIAGALWGCCTELGLTKGLVP